VKKISFLFLLSLNLCKCQTYSPGFDFTLFNDTPVSELAHAVENENITRIMECVLQKKMNINYQEPKFGNSVLQLALQNNKLLSTQKLLSLGADPNLRSLIDNSTPFLDFCKYSYDINKAPEILSLLIQHGADINSEQIQQIKNSAGQLFTYRRTALEYTCSFGTVDLVRILIDSGAKLDVYPKDGERSIIATALDNNSLSILKYLLIEKKVAIPNYISIRQLDAHTFKKMTLTQLLYERPSSPNKNEEKTKAEILAFLENKENI